MERFRLWFKQQWNSIRSDPFGFLLEVVSFLIIAIMVGTLIYGIITGKFPSDGSGGGSHGVDLLPMYNGHGVNLVPIIH